MALRNKPTRWTNESFTKAVGKISPSITVIGKYKRLSDKIDLLQKLKIAQDTHRQMKSDIRTFDIRLVAKAQDCTRHAPTDEVRH